MTRINCMIFITMISLLYTLSYANPLIGPNVREALPNELNFVVSLSIKNRKNIVEDENNHFCGGVLISNKHVLTSAHCKDSVKVRDVVVKIGSTDLRNAPKYNIKKWITFKEWKNGLNIGRTILDDDISIIELSKNVDPSIKPAAIAKFDANYNLIGTKAVAAGWGTTNNGVYPRHMLVASLNVISQRECYQNIREADRGNNVVLHYGTICTNAQPYAVIACGDSGSPLLINDNEVIGINDCSGPAQGEEYVPLEQNLHLRVDNYDAFIDAVVNKKESNSLCWRKRMSADI